MLSIWPATWKWLSDPLGSHLPTFPRCQGPRLEDEGSDDVGSLGPHPARDKPIMALHTRVPPSPYCISTWWARSAPD